MIEPETYTVFFTDTYILALSIIKRHGRDIAEAIQEEAEGLGLFPEKKGKALVRELAGLWSRRACRQRYRIIYRIRKDKLIVEVVFVGIRKEGSRKDVYAQARKLLKSKR